MSTAHDRTAALRNSQQLQSPAQDQARQQLAGSGKGSCANHCEGNVEMTVLEQQIQEDKGIRSSKVTVL